MAYPELRENYELHEKLGEGGFAKVRAAVHKLTGEKVAIKIMDKECLGADLPRAYREIKALKKLHHQHICQLFQVMETDKMIYLVIEFCPGGELFDYIVSKERLKEKEARAFFRQIVSALRYIHEAGFVHRDLKPENLLLDDDSNIKLIDFGLVSEPDINVTDVSPVRLLETCCGSPAYAAPELIKGGPYIGPCADIWSLGVLLYALLNGFLPFDDDSTPRLYQLIQQGEYEIPDWLTPGSVGIISRLLQTNPHERISVDSLMIDSWVKKGYGKGVDWRSRVNTKELDKDCVKEMAHHFHMSEQDMTSRIQKWEYNDITALYFLLAQKKNRGCTPTIITSSLGLTTNQFSNLSIRTNGSSGSSNPNSDSPLAYISQSADASQEVPLSTESDEVFSPPPTIEAVHGRARRMSLGQPMHPPHGELLTVQKVDKPVINPTISAIQDEELGEPFQPQRRRGTHSPVAPAASVPLSRTMDFSEVVPSKTAVTKTRSYESRLQYAIDDDRRATLTPDNASPKRRRRGRLGSLEILSRVKKVFAHRKSSDASAQSGPRKVKGVYDISTTSRKDTQEVLEELENALRQLDVNFRKEGYVMKCTINSHKPSTNHKGKVMEIKFELEVCLLPRLEMLGVRRKRIHGDIWEFKRICDQIFKATHL